MVDLNKGDWRAIAEQAARLPHGMGDVHPGDMARIASAYTPVPGGVGPLTIAMLMRNTIEAAERRVGIC